MAPGKALIRRLSSLSSAMRFVQRPVPRRTGGRALHQNRLVLPAEGLALPTGDRLLERLRSLGSPNRFHLDSLTPPPLVSVSADDARKLLRASRVAAVRARLRASPEGVISYPEFVRICGGGDEGIRIAKALDGSGDVIVLGDVVLLRPDQVAQAIQGVIHNSARKKTNNRELDAKELMEMETVKAEIDAKAEAGVKKELWWGLALLATQTAGFMRLTFWELSWDVMEPVCFYVTSLYFMIGYAFFLRTSRDPSFEGFFQTRFATRQQRLLKAAKFDMQRFHDLRCIVHGHSDARTRMAAVVAPRSTTLSYCEHGQHTETALLGSVH